MARHMVDQTTAQEYRSERLAKLSILCMDETDGGEIPWSYGRRV